MRSFIQNTDTGFSAAVVQGAQIPCLTVKKLLVPLSPGEMSHHDVLDAASKGINVILCEHSNTERGFLSDLQEMLGAHLENKINIILSETDRDPLCVV